MKVTIEKATKVAQSVILQKFDNYQMDGDALVLAFTAQNPDLPQSPVAYYVFNVGKEGFIIIAGDDVAKPLLGYSTEGIYDTENVPPNFQDWMDDITNAITQTVNSELAGNKYFSEEWEAYLNNDVEYFLERISDPVVSPLLKTKWNQAAPYWNHCPTFEGKPCVTGCVATAMAQIIAYHKHPYRGGAEIISGYTTRTLKINIPPINPFNRTYLGGGINEKEKPETEKEKEIVARLMFHCGASVQMDYTPDGSGCNMLIGNSLTNYFGYDKALSYEQRDYYNHTQWKYMLREEIKAKRPVYYDGRIGGGGHAFVCDGFDESDNFHFNWGWGGSGDGYFPVEPLKQFPNNNNVYTKIQPDKKDYYQMYLEPDSILSANKTEVKYEEEFTVTVTFKNAGWNDFPGGEYAIAEVYLAGIECVGSILGKEYDDTIVKSQALTKEFKITCKIPKNYSGQIGNIFVLTAAVRAKKSNTWTRARGTIGNKINIKLIG